MPGRKVLILGGTPEASALAAAVHDKLAGQAEVILSLAGLVAPRRPHPCAVRSGGFGGMTGLEDYLRRENIALLVDATHPFAARISENAHAAALRAEVPRLALVRPAWEPEPGDRWLEVDDFAEAARVLPRFARRVLLAVGRRNLGPFAGLEGIHLVVRLLEAPAEPPPLADFELAYSQPPHALETERAFLRDHAIDTIVARQSGGKESYAKLAAARELGLRVVLIARPPEEPGPTVATVEEALAWIEGQLR